MAKVDGVDLFKNKNESKQRHSLNYDTLEDYLKIRSTRLSWKLMFCVLNKDVAHLNVYNSKFTRAQGKRKMCLRLLESVIDEVKGTKTQFTITDRKGKQYRFKTAGSEDRQRWIHRIKAVVYTHIFIANQRESKKSHEQYAEVYHRFQADADKLLQSVSVKRRHLIDKVKFDHTIPEEEQYSLQQFFDASKRFINATVSAVNQMEEVKYKLNNNAFTVEPSPDEAKPKSPNLAKMSTWSDTQVTEWFDARSSESNTKGDVQSNEGSDTGSYSTTSGNFKETAHSEDNSEDEDADEPETSKIMNSVMFNFKGGDLSKLGIPVYVLAKQSFLEKFASYFANADYFPGYSNVEISQNSRERFMDVVKWYISSFKPGWNDRSRKPYNPVLGEVFECYFHSSDLAKQKLAPAGSHLRLDFLQSSNKCGGLNISSPAFSRASSRLDGSENDTVVNWAGEDDVVFVAEQVSHHPPISAFYAESLSKSIQISGHALAKTYLNGFSVVMKMEGESILKLLKFAETYVITFPTVYGRSVLSKPWAELGDTATITCLETGYKAQITFHTKGYMGSLSNLHFMTGKFFDARNNQFAFIKGHWNKAVKIYLDENINKSTKVSDEMMSDFVQVEGMNVLKKRVKPLSEQAPNESRRVWEKLTENLRAKNWPEAEKEKQNIEQRQRDQEKERTRNQEKWVPRFFEVYKQSPEWGNCFRYKNELSTRLAKDKSV